MYPSYLQRAASSFILAAARRSRISIPNGSSIRADQETSFCRRPKRKKTSPTHVIVQIQGKILVTQDTRQRLVALLPRLRRFAYGLCGSKDEGDDLVQAACERALSRLDQWQEGTRLDSWMFRVVQTIWIDRIRAQKVRGIVSDITDADHLVGDDGARSTEARLTLNTVREAIADLPEDQRIVLVMVSVDGRSYKETAEALDLPIGTVTSRLARARLRLHAAVHGSAGPDTAPEDSAKEPERG